LTSPGRDTPGAGQWAVERVEAGAGWLHGEGLPVPDRRRLRVAAATASALVLGSTQPAADVDAAAAAALGVEVVRRRSGGGAVLVEPGVVTWVDLCVPAGDPLWQDDVGRAAWWVGEAWAEALGRLGVGGTAAHRGGMVSTPWSARVCFAGLGPGEVRVGDAKVVGVSQRRTRAGAVFQTAALTHWDPAATVACLAVDDRAGAAAELTGSAAGLADLGVAARPEAVVNALLASLPGPEPGTTA
jgi:lipoate-protein ligase A